MYTLVGTKDNYINGLGVTIEGASYFICDSDDDISHLPTTLGVGSRAMVIPTGQIYMLSPSKVWTLYKGVSILN